MLFGVKEDGGVQRKNAIISPAHLPKPLQNTDKINIRGEECVLLYFFLFS